MQYENRQPPDAMNSDFDWVRDAMTDLATCMYIAGVKRMPPTVVTLHVDYDETGHILGHELRLLDLDEKVQGSDEEKLEVGATFLKQIVSQRDDVLLSGFIFDEPVNKDVRRVNLAVCSREELQQQFRLAGRVDGGYRLVPL